MSFLISVEMVVSSYLSDLYLWISAFMVGDFAVFGEGFGKLRSGDSFVEFWVCFRYLLIGIALAVGVTDFISPYLQILIYSHFQYVVGITSSVIGTFFLWIVYAFDFDISTQWKWLFAVICYLILVLNVAILYVS